MTAFSYNRVKLGPFREMWLAGVPSPEIAARLRVTHSCVMKWRAKMDLPRRAWGGPRPGAGRPLSTGRDAERRARQLRAEDVRAAKQARFREMWLAGELMPAIARELAISEDTMRQWCARLGIPKRTPGWHYRRMVACE